MSTEALVHSGSSSPATVIDRGGVQALSISTMKQRAALVLEAMANVLDDGKDYGKIPGTDKPTLYKPGAEKLCMMFQLAADRPLIEDIGVADEIRYRVHVPIMAPDGRTIAVGVGEASSNEEKYRWRRPVCDEEFADTDAALRREKWFRGSPNWKGKQIRTSPADIANTVLKMAHKRGFIHATLLATAASSVFNQDLEDFTKELQESLVEGDAAPKSEARQPQRKSASASSTSSAKPLPANAQTITGVISKLYDDKKPYAVYLKGSQTKYTGFDDATLKDLKAFTGTDHAIKLAFTVTDKDGRQYYNIAGVSIADAEPAQAAAAPTNGAPKQGSLVDEREPGSDG